MLKFCRSATTICWHQWHVYQKLWKFDVGLEIDRTDSEKSILREFTLIWNISLPQIGTSKKWPTYDIIS